MFNDIGTVHDLIIIHDIVHDLVIHAQKLIIGISFNAFIVLTIDLRHMSSV